MGSKKSRGAGAKYNVVERAMRALGNGQTKQALKELRAEYRVRPTDELRAALVHASIVRAREQIARRLIDEAREVLKQAIDLATPSSASLDEVAALLAIVGMSAELGRLLAASASEESRLGCLRGIVDAAISHGLPHDQLPEEVRGEVRLVQQALDKISADDDAEAATLLSGIPRQSHAADWKLFARGWSACRRGNQDDAEANWSRLDPARPASRAAARLRVLAGWQAGARIEGDFALDAAGPAGAVIGDLKHLKRLIAERSWKDVGMMLRYNRAAWDKLDASLGPTVAEIVCSEAVRAARPRVIDDLAKCAVAAPLDPQWNRARALAAERIEEFEPHQIDYYWTCYLHDLGQITALSPDDRRLAQALVYERLGEMWAAQTYDDWTASDYDAESNAAEQHARDRCTSCLERAIEGAPELRSAYVTLIQKLDGWDEHARQIEFCRKMLAQFPDDAWVLRHAVNACGMRDDPLTGREFLLKAIEASPLDRSLLSAAWGNYLASARQLALAKRWDEGRAAFEMAAKYTEHGMGRAYELARRSIFELAAGDEAASRAAYEQALDATEHPLAVMYVRAVEAHRYHLGRFTCARLQRAWRDALRKRGITAASVATVCTCAHAFIEIGVEYDDLYDDLDQIAKCARKSLKGDISADDLRKLALFVDDLPDEDALLKRIVNKGCKDHPGEAFFHFMAGEIEFRKGPFDCNRRKAATCFRATIERAEKSADSRDKSIANLAQARLKTIDVVGGMPIGGGRRGRSAAGRRASAGPKMAEGMNPIDMIRDVVETMCEKEGIDPDEMMSHLADELGIPQGARKG